ncbi:phospholipase D-like domain-containing protein [Undibacterium sp. Di26W]|uniref:phospholipase D-like domain-containing protein n=1 Tax=Undibacterium sp. Di26W TaxID=3413035 RepID=UPI003BF2D530
MPGNLSTSINPTSASSGALTVRAYSGDQCVMLAFNVDEHKKADLAGFSIRRRFKDGSWSPLLNRLSFTSDYTSETTAEDRKWHSSEDAPFQKFWWVDFPAGDAFGEYEYEVAIKSFSAAHTSALTTGDTVSIKVMCQPFKQKNFELAFTRGYLSSQAYTDKFGTKAIGPNPKTVDFPTADYVEQYQWLGAHARVAIIDFLNECYLNKDATLDAMVYDFNEPDIVRALTVLGKKVRIVMDNSATHVGAKALEPQAEARLQKSAGKANVKTGNFSRYQHNKVFIMRVKGKPARVLTGSTNFSVTGLYVNANHVAIFDDDDVAQLYAQSFEAAFNGGLSTSAFTADKISQQEYAISKPGLPSSVFSFAPHKKNTFSLDRLQNELNTANSSVLFAVMALVGKSSVLDTLRTIHDDGKIFSYGITDNPGGADGEKNSTDETKSVSGIQVYSPGKPGVLVTSAALNKLVPPPFNKEMQEGLAHKIHHKFVVVDFNDTNPVVFFGSSNLAEGGEQENGDNLIAIYDQEIATVFAIEAVRLVDHYAFRAAVSTAQKATPLRLKFNDEDWSKNYYTPGHIKFKERILFSKS